MKSISILLFVSIAGISQAQKLKESEVPAVVKQAFSKKFPLTKSVAWSMESATEFEAEFKVNGGEQSANFDKEGKWLVTETEIKSAQLPAAIQTTLKNDFKDYKITEAEKAETAAGELFYEVSAKKGKSNLEIKFSTDGKVVSKEEKKEKED